jgi:hypothetical protein
MAAQARLARVQTSNATNPTFTLTTTGREFSFGESAAYIIVLGDRVTGKVRRSLVEYLFGKMRPVTSYPPNPSCSMLTLL